MMRIKGRESENLFDPDCTGQFQGISHYMFEEESMHSASMQVEHSSKMSLSAIDNSRNKGDSFKFFSLTEDSSISKNPLLPTRVSDPSVFQFHLISDDGSSQNTSD